MKKFLLNIIKFIAGLFPASFIISTYIFLCKNSAIRTILNKIIKSVIPEKLSIEEGVLILDTGDAVVSGALVFGVYEKFESKLFRERLRPGMAVVDIGANIGYFSLIASKRVGESGKVFSFEPDRTNFACLQKMIGENKCSNTTIFNEALGDRSGTIDLYLSSVNKGDHRVYQVENEKREKISVPIQTLDVVLKSVGNPKIDLIKMDVQGAEGLVVKGMVETLANNPKMIIFSEFWPEGIRKTGVDPLYVLQEFGKYFSIFEINESKESLDVVKDFEGLIKKCPGRKYTNIICMKP